jgi:pimeloyl-ACP methyl ester carboxylesterase
MTATAPHVIAAPLDTDLDVRTFRISSRTHTPGPTFVLLHGIGLSHRFFSRLGRRLSAHGDVIAFDLPGFGQTRRPDRTLAVEGHAAVIAERLITMGAAPVVVVGHSMGAQFAIELARRQPHLVDRLILSGPVTDPTHRTLRAQAIGLARDSPLEPPLTQLSVAMDYVRCGIRWFLRQAVIMRDYPSHLAIADVARPVLVLRGAHDPIAGHEWCSRLAGLAHDGYLVEVPGGRHNIPHAAAAETAAAILDFTRGRDVTTHARTPRHAATARRSHRGR